MQDDMKEAEALELFTSTGALMNGHFALRSGLHSDRFFQCALVLQYPALAERLCGALAGRLRAHAAGEAKVDGVIAPALGGIPVGHEVGRALDVKALFAEKNPEGRLVLRRGFRIRPGERFVVAEDVITRGGRVQETIDIVHGAGGKVTAVLVIVDRSGGTASFEAPLFSLVRMTPAAWEPSACPLCRQNLPIDRPGS